MHSEDSGQAGRPCYFDGFLLRWLICTSLYHVCKGNKQHNKLDLNKGTKIEPAHDKTNKMACASSHYENMPIQIYRKFHPKKLKIFR